MLHRFLQSCRAADQLHVFDVFLVGDEPRLPQPDGHFDAIWGISVFSHVDSRWAEWLLELRRVLADDGWLL